ncbi:eCIS core domain-containing protein [Streptomyces mangrovi]|uniref:eCIS core domain-containing protein n=1 Tax=Streptomyces mangrovi TaxID=1206892 RepID=UPI00399CD52F
MQRPRQRTERSEDRQSASGRPAARRETSGDAAVPPPLTADALRAAQRGAGNDAVNAMIARRTRATPVPEEQLDTGVQDVLHSAGKPLAAPVRREMEARFGTGFSDVRLHTGGAAARSARAIGARAYTSGSHVVIGDGGGDKHTLAHELTHVVQQRQGPVSGTDHGDGLRVSDPSDRFEREAEANAHKVMSAPAPDVQRTPESVGRDVTGEGDTVQRASATVLENATVASYKPGKESTPPLPTLHDLPIQRPRTVTGPVSPTGTAGRSAAPNPIAVERLHAAYKREGRARGVRRGAPTEDQVWKDLFSGAGYDRGHVMGLEVGGSDVRENIVPQWSLNQGTGMWRRIEQAMVGVGAGTVRFEVSYDTDHGGYRRVMIPVKIDIYLNNASYKSWENEPDINDLIRAGRDPSDLAEYYTKVKDKLNGQRRLTEEEMQDFAVRALAHDRAAFLSHQDYENISAQGQTPGTSAAGTYMQGMSRSTFPKNRRDKLIQSYVDAGWVTKTGTGKSATYTLDDVPAPASDSDLDSGSESDDAMSIDSRQSSPGQPFGTIRFDSQSSDSDSDYEDRMSISSD